MTKKLNIQAAPITPIVAMMESTEPETEVKPVEVEAAPMIAPPKAEVKTVHMHLLLTKSRAKEIKRLAKMRGLSVNAFVDWAIDVATAQKR